MRHTRGGPLHTTYYTRIRPLSAYRAAYSVCMHTGGRLLLRCDRLPSQAVGSPVAQSAGVANLPVVHKPLNSTRIIRMASIISFLLEVSPFSQGNHPFNFVFFCHFNRILRGGNQRTVVCSTFSPSLSQVAIAYAVLYAYHTCVCIQLHTYAPPRVGKLTG